MHILSRFYCHRKDIIATSGAHEQLLDTLIAIMIIIMANFDRYQLNIITSVMTALIFLMCFVIITCYVYLYLAWLGV